MADSIRKQIMATLDARFKTMWIENGYKTDMGAIKYPTPFAVTQANMRLSLADGAAFVDASGPDLDYPDALLVVTDSAGKKAKGYIKSAGLGETYGEELLTSWPTNAGFETFETSGKNITSAINIFGGSTCLSNDFSMLRGALYAISWPLVKNSGSSPYGVINIIYDGTPIVAFSVPIVGSGGVYAYKYTEVLGGGLGKNIFGTASTTDFSISPSIKQQLSPSATGVTITSTPGGTTYNWASIETGFNYNDPAGYTIQVYDPAVYHWQLENIPEDECPSLIYQDATDSEEPATMGEMEHTLPLEIYFKYAAATMADIYDGMDDVMTAMAVDDTLGELLTMSFPRGNNLTVEASGQSVIVTAQISMELTYRTDKWKL